MNHLTLVEPITLKNDLQKILDNFSKFLDKDKIESFKINLDFILDGVEGSKKLQQRYCWHRTKSEFALRNFTSFILRLTSNSISEWHETGLEKEKERAKLIQENAKQISALFKTIPEIYKAPL